MEYLLQSNDSLSEDSPVGTNKPPEDSEVVLLTKSATRQIFRNTETFCVSSHVSTERGGINFPRISPPRGKMIAFSNT